MRPGEKSGSDGIEPPASGVTGGKRAATTHDDPALPKRAAVRDGEAEDLSDRAAGQAVQRRVESGAIRRRRWSMV
jgi:hypothetical protein